MSADCYILIEKPEGRKNNMGNYFILADTLRMEDIEPIAAADIDLTAGSLQAGLVGKRKADEPVFLIVIADGFIKIGRDPQFIITGYDRLYGGMGTK